MNRHLSLKEIREWLSHYQRRLHHGDLAPTMTSIAERAGISRQTLYALLNDERTEFGEVAQIRLSRVIGQISSEPSYQSSKIAKIDFTGAVPRIRFGV